MDIPPKTEAAITRDFQRDVWCLFGLPVDNMTMVSTKAMLRERGNQDGTTVLSTINVNWVVQSFSDPEFRSAILNSDLVTLDGKPLLWLAKLFGCPMRETVPGSSLIEELLEDKTDKPLTIFLFGGEGNAAELAMTRINQRRGGLRAIGAYNPGFGTVNDMSSDAIIDAINSTKPDILLVALGAKKGTQWIERNRNQLNAKIISHLGATINFLSGTVKRAPRFMQRMGLEWAWRILQEPKLLARYTSDGCFLLRVIIESVFPWLQYRKLKKKCSRQPVDDTVISSVENSCIKINLGRNLQITPTSHLRQIFSNVAIENKNVTLDFHKTEFADSSFFGLLIILHQRLQNTSYKIKMVNCNEALTNLIYFSGLLK